MSADAISPRTREEHAADERDRVAAALRELGLTDRPEEYSDGIHSWRCEHPERYGRCNCFEEAVDHILTVVRDA